MRPETPSKNHGEPFQEVDELLKIVKQSMKALGTGLTTLVRDDYILDTRGQSWGRRTRGQIPATVGS